MSAEILLPGLLPLAVYPWIERLREQGGPDERDWARAKDFGELVGTGRKSVLDEKGEHVKFVKHPLYGDAEPEDLLFASKRKGDTAAMFNGLAFALAVMAFNSGGVKFAGTHYFGREGDKEEWLKVSQGTQ